MRVIKPRRGAGLVDLIVTVFLLGVTGVIFSAAFPIGVSASRQAQDYKIATAIVQRKSEQLRSLDYQSLTHTLLAQAGIIDVSDSSSPYSFTSVDSVASQLSSGSGTIEITDVQSDLKKAQITISWTASSGLRRSVQATALFADRRPRAINP